MEGLNPGGPVHCKGELVVYRNSGIYRISDIRNEKFCGISERTYYVMCSVYDKSSVIYVPVDAKDITLAMRNIMSREEADEAVSRARCSANDWICDAKERAEYFDRLFDSGCCSDILWLYKVLTLYKTDTESSRKRLYASDARILAAAEKIITEEFSFILGIDRGEVLPYISEKLYK